MEAKKIVLIVEDNIIIRKSIKRQINKIYEKENSDVICLSDGFELLNILMIHQRLNNSVKMIISDEQMSYLNGSEAFNILNKMYVDKKINKIPFIISSSNKENDNTFPSNSIDVKKENTVKHHGQNATLYLLYFIYWCPPHKSQH